jgi:hypothetical protein
MDKRNHMIHGNVNPEKEKIGEVYFQGTIPLFKEPGDNIDKVFEALERQYQAKTIIGDYEDMHEFFLYVRDCFRPDMRDQIWSIIEDNYPGYEVERKITGRLFPNYVVNSYLEGIRFDDELQVAWP